eukprot:Rmarinus@m.25914
MAYITLPSPGLSPNDHFSCSYAATRNYSQSFPHSHTQHMKSGDTLGSLHRPPVCLGDTPLGKGPPNNLLEHFNYNSGSFTMRSLVWFILGLLASVFSSLLYFISPAYASGLSAEAIADRLRHIPVYCITNVRGQPVLSPSPKGGKERIAYIFFCRHDAEDTLKRLHGANPHLADQTIVQLLSLRDVYLAFVKHTRQQRSSGSDQVVPQFCPPREQVAEALELLRKSGRVQSSFQGTPVFQAEGLVVSESGKQELPVFLSRGKLEDLWRAMRAKNPALSALPKIEVGTLEVCLMQMEQSQDKDWERVVFVPMEDSTPKATTRLWQALLPWGRR